MIMQVAVSSVNCGLKLKPTWVKNSIVFFRSLTGRLTNILRDMSKGSFQVLKFGFGVFED